MADLKNSAADNSDEQNAIEEVKYQSSKITVLIFIGMIAVVAVVFVAVKLIGNAVKEHNEDIVKNVVEQQNAETVDELIEMYTKALAYGNSSELLSTVMPDFYVAAAVQRGEYESRESAEEEFSEVYSLNEISDGFRQSYGDDFTVESSILKDIPLSDDIFNNLSGSYNETFGMDIEDAHNIEYKTVISNNRTGKFQQATDELTAVKIGSCWYIALYDNQ